MNLNRRRKKWGARVTVSKGACVRIVLERGCPLIRFVKKKLGRDMLRPVRYKGLKRSARKSGNCSGQ